MEQFDKISIAEISKKNLYLILNALLVTGNNTNDLDYIDLRNSIIEELSILANCSKEDFLTFISKY